MDMFVVHRIRSRFERAIDDVYDGMRTMRGLRPGQKTTSTRSRRKVRPGRSQLHLVARVLMFAALDRRLDGGGHRVVRHDVSVTERTRRDRRAQGAGATRREVMWNSGRGGTLTLVGGVVGMVVGWGIAILMHSFTPVPAYVPLGSNHPGVTRRR